MKKTLAMLLIAVLLPFAAVNAGAEDLTGNWYADLFGLIFTMELRADGTLTLTSSDQNSAEGTWAVDGDQLYLNKGQADETTLTISEGRLSNPLQGLNFGREPIEAFIPPTAVKAEKAEDFGGVWKLNLVSTGGMTLSGETALSAVQSGGAAVKDDTLVFENGAVRLFGAPMPEPFEFVEGHLFAASPHEDFEDLTQAIELNDDGSLVLRMAGFDYYFNRAE